MLSTIIYYAILSTCIIVIGHVLWNQFSETVITPKPRHTPSKKYQEIIQELQSSPHNSYTNANTNANANGFISEEDKRAMMEELQALISGG